MTFRFYTVVFLCLLGSVQLALAAEGSEIKVDQAYLLNLEKGFSPVYPEMRLSDYTLFRSSYAQGGDLFQQFVRFLFPISGREKRTQFLSSPYWGLKKPRYKKFAWERFESDHYDFYTYPEGQRSLQTVIKYFEEEYDRNNRIFGVQNRFKKKTPVIFYQSRRDFEQTSIVDGPIPEGLGGLTEIFGWKRVTFPFEGEKNKFEHVTKHEATHIFQIEKKARRLPLWFIEGSAETNSVYWDADAEMIIRDAYLNGFFFPIDQLWQIQGTWLMYKIGNYISNLIWDEYGEEGFHKIFGNADQMRFDANIKKSLGITVAELNQKVQAKLLLDYGHLLKQKDVLDKSVEVEKDKIILDSHKKFFVTGGAAGAKNALFLHYRDQGESDRVTLVVDKQYENESLESFRKGVDLTDTHVIYSIKRSRRDELRIQPYELIGKNKKIKLQEAVSYRWSHIDRIEHPVMASSTYVYFIGYEHGYSNIYKANLKNKNVEKVTDDLQHYDHLDFCKGKKLFTFSREDERDPEYIHYDRHIYTMTMGGEMQKITSKKGHLYLQPSFSADCSAIVYVSNDPQTYNLFVYDLAEKKHQQLTYARVGVKHPFWGPDHTILFNAYEKMSPTIYETQFPTHKEVLLRSSRNVREFSTPLSLHLSGRLKYADDAGQPVASDPVFDGLHVYKKHSTVQEEGQAYSVQSASHLQDRVLVRTQEGLPQSDQVKRNAYPHYFEIDGRKITSLQSNMVATSGIADEAKGWISTKLKGQGIVQGWTSRNNHKVLVAVNNRLANDYKKYKSEAELSLYIYDPKRNFLELLPDGPISDLDQNIQWVSFLDNGYILIVEAETKAGPYRLIIYNTDKKVFSEVAQDASLFKVSQDRTKMVWKTSHYMFLNLSQTSPHPRKIKIAKGEIRNLAILANDNIGFAAIDKGAVVWVEIDPTSMEAIKTVKHVFKGETIQHVQVHPAGHILVNTKKKFGKVFRYGLWQWDVDKNKVCQVRSDLDAAIKVVARGRYVTFVEKYFYARPSREFVFDINDPTVVYEFDPEERAQVIDQRYWVFEGKRALQVYDLQQTKTVRISQNSMGFDVEGTQLYYSGPVGQNYQIQSYDFVTQQRNAAVSPTESNQIKPLVWGEKLRYLQRTASRWGLVAYPDADNDEKLLEVIDIEKHNDDEVYVYIKPKQVTSSSKPLHETTADYPQMYLARPSNQKLKVQSLAAAAAYDGNAVRLLVSGFADNLFGDKGIFVNSILLSDTKFAAIGYSDLARGFNTSVFFNQREGIQSYGLNFTQDFIFDRYRQLSAYSEFEIQDYAQDSSARNTFLTPRFDGQQYYLAKLGAVYAFDITVRDRHGPISGQRLFFRAESGFDLEKIAFSSYDLNADIRLYNRVLPRFGFAHRLVGGTSQGSVPNVYLLGGNMSFRGVGFDDLKGHNYWVFSEDMRIPVFDFIGAKLFDPLDQMLGFLTRYFDVRSGIYADVGSVWNNGDDANVQYSVGYFINIPTAFGFVVRLHDGIWGEDNFGFWIGTNW